jgi:hypothetical protein
MKVEGACHCGQVSYEAEVNPETVLLCNCTDCQVLTGSAFRLSVPAPSWSFRLLSGRPSTYVKTADSGTRRAHSFCPNCGTPVFACAADGVPPTYSLRVGGLKQRHDLPPTIRTWCKSALLWAQDVSVIPGQPGQ